MPTRVKAWSGEGSKSGPGNDRATAGRMVKKLTEKNQADIVSGTVCLQREGWAGYSEAGYALMCEAEAPLLQSIPPHTVPPSPSDSLADMANHDIGPRRQEGPCQRGPHAQQPLSRPGHGPPGQHADQEGRLRHDEHTQQAGGAAHQGVLARGLSQHQPRQRCGQGRGQEEDAGAVR